MKLNQNITKPVEVTFFDSRLEATIREILGKPDGAINSLDIQNINEDKLQDPKINMFCSQCGAEKPRGAKFCSQCGTKFDTLAELKEKYRIWEWFCCDCGAKLSIYGDLARQFTAQEDFLEASRCPECREKYKKESKETHEWYCKDCGCYRRSFGNHGERCPDCQRKHIEKYEEHTQRLNRKLERMSWDCLDCGAKVNIHSVGHIYIRKDVFNPTGEDGYTVYMPKRCQRCDEKKYAGLDNPQRDNEVNWEDYFSTLTISFL